MLLWPPSILYFFSLLERRFVSKFLLFLISLTLGWIGDKTHRCLREREMFVYHYCVKIYLWVLSVPYLAKIVVFGQPVCVCVSHPVQNVFHQCFTLSFTERRNQSIWNTVWKCLRCGNNSQEVLRIFTTKSEEKSFPIHSHFISTIRFSGLF